MSAENIIEPSDGIRIGQRNMMWGLWAMGLFMFLGFVLVYLRDFAPNAVEWASQYGSGKHFETRLAHVHGTLFGFLNVSIGYLLFQVRICTRWAKMVSYLALAGLLMPIGILAEVTLGAPPALVLVGAASMTFSILIFGFAIYRHRLK